MKFRAVISHNMTEMYEIYGKNFAINVLEKVIAPLDSADDF